MSNTHATEKTVERGQSAKVVEQGDTISPRWSARRIAKTATGAFCRRPTVVIGGTRPDIFTSHRLQQC